MVAVLVALVGLSASSRPAAKLCSALANGAVPYAAIGQAYSEFGQEGRAAEVLRRAASDIRSTCPERESVAQSADALAAMSEGRLPFAMPAYVGAPATSIAPAVRNYELKITGSAKRATVYYGVAGSSGGGDAVGVPWSKRMSDSTGGYSSATLSATTDMGTKGNLTCSIVDTDSGAVLDTKTAESQGGSYGYASVSCSASS
ncbi:hypothetical protein [Actinomycetospora termitidis]|uniref:Ig-like domain-containing protein n=1 Tax=Actinomycetospora termitidis TaxID=3053470 RepID=A0ABT7MJ13_9PSEU|nr:hypothetical protein [Actinomycetospora sp. Odt1-22]MDL5160199.1 hypothetical protein [Actinomycetospora sp. Odt1-22]